MGTTMKNQFVIQRRQQVAGWIVAIGMIIELLTLLWLHPISFLVYLFASLTLIIVGIVYYLISLLRVDQTQDERI